MNRVVEFALRNRFLVIVFAVLVIAVGIWAMQALPIDAVPDITPNQVVVLTNSPGLGPLEIERLVTFPVETAMSGLPGVTEIRSVSRFGLSSVTIFFKEGMDVYFCRRLVMERLPQAKEAIPAGFGTPEMGPISTGLGEIYQFEVRGDGKSLMELRSILEWDIAPILRSVPGVVEVNSYGGELKTYEVQLDANRLVSYNIPLSKVFEALEKNNFNSGGGYIEHNQEQYVVRGEGLVGSLEDIGNIVVGATKNGTPVYIKNLGNVQFAPMLRQGAATRDGRGEVVTGVVMMLIGENSRVVANQVDKKLLEIQKTLPQGVTVDTYYDRTHLVQQTIKTVEKNLVEGALLVIVILLLLLGNIRGALIVAAAIPLSMLAAFAGMVWFGISGNLMSLGAIDFGLIVDGSVVMVENIIRHLAEAKSRGEKNNFTVVLDSAREVARPVFFAVLIIIVVYVPILTLEGVEGKMFRPMALTVIFALIASLVFALTLMPVLSSFFLAKNVKEEESKLIHKVKEHYIPWLKRVMIRPGLTAAVATVVLVVGVVAAIFMGAEFIPRLDEGTIALQTWRLPSVALSESVHSTTMVEKVLKQFPEVETVVSRTGRAEIATDPMGVEVSDVYVILKPHDEWKTASNREGLIEAFDKALKDKVPGNIFSYSQPIELRMQELIAGVRSDVAITLYGSDLDMLRQKADEIVRVVSQIPGAADVKAEQTGGLPYLRVNVKRDQIARYGINTRDVLDAVEAIGGKEVGQVLEGQKRFALQVRFEKSDRDAVEKIGNIKVADPQGRLIPISQLAELKVEEGPAQISRSDIHRRISVEANVRGRDLSSFIKDAQAAVGSKVSLPTGYWITWGGQFENLERATQRLMIVVPLSMFLIFILLYTTFNTMRPALLIFLNVPIAASGGILALALRGLPLSISAGVGFIAVSGIAVLNGVVLISYILQRRREGAPLEDAVTEGAITRLRPVLMTALVASLGFVPMALATSAGAEVQRPLATVVIGGLVTSTLLTLFVLPTLYRWFEARREEVEI
ncbi:MAG TPA: CusA/CzcA family heavy metal efflux RND transporter [Terriglobales bacterium]|nr:CusA/CzcA family heavy metal efflux RND transporter [Terriglobales bacterium]